MNINKDFEAIIWGYVGVIILFIAFLKNRFDWVLSVILIKIVFIDFPQLLFTDDKPFLPLEN